MTKIKRIIGMVLGILFRIMYLSYDFHNLCGSVQCDESWNQGLSDGVWNVAAAYHRDHS